MKKNKLQQFYDSRYEKGLCVYCGKNPYTPNKKTCQECRTKKANARKLKKLMADNTEKY